MYDLYDRILGSLVASGMGDGIGAPTEAMSRAEIIERFGGPIQGFVPPTGNFYCEGNEMGEVTDDTSQLVEVAKAVIKANGDLTTDSAADALLAWSENWPKHYPRNAGPTMREWVVDYKRYKEEGVGDGPIALGMVGRKYGRGISNGCAMRVAPAALVNPGNLEKTIENTVALTRVSHGTQHALSGACAVACAISEALKEDSDVHSILKAAVYGCKRGEQIGKEIAREAYGPRVLPRLIRAIEIAYEADNADEASKMIEEEIGCNGDIQPSVGVVFGLFAANDGDIEKCLLAAANIGGDTDTFGCIIGMICGAYKGFSSIPEEWKRIFAEGNPRMFSMSDEDIPFSVDRAADMQFKPMAKAITEIAKKRI